MAERFENLDNILLVWAKEKIQKSLVTASNSYEKHEEEKKNIYFLGSDSEKNTRAVSVGSRARLNQKQNWPPN